MILGLHGKMSAGKNAAARRLALLTPDVREVSFAAKLKESAAAVLGVTVAQLEGWKNDPETWVVVDRSGDFVASQSVRSFLQRYGTEAHRDVFGADFWLDAALPRDRDYSDGLYVVTDVRFENEAARVRDLGGAVVHVVGPWSDTGDHPSERVLPCDWIVDNSLRDDGFAALDCQLLALLARVGERRAA